MGFSRFYWVLMCSNGLHFVFRILFRSWYLVLQEFADCYLVLVDSIGLSLGLKGFYCFFFPSFADIQSTFNRVLLVFFPSLES